MSTSPSSRENRAIPCEILDARSSITAPVIALIYIFATSAILAYVSPDSVDVVGPIPQALRLGFGDLGAVIVPVAIFLLLANYLSTFSLYFSGSARLPMAAGWDHLLPAWFSRLHARYKTPVNSILFLGGATLAASIAALIGVGEQEAFELLLTWGFTFYGVAYLALFAIPLFAPKASGIRPRLALRVAAASGFLVTLLIRHPVDLSCHPRREPVPLFAEDCRSRARRQPSRLDDLSRGPAQDGTSNPVI